MKKLKLLALGLISLLAVNVSAAEISASGDLAACLTGSETTCKLTENYNLTVGVTVVGDKVLDLNGKKLTLAHEINLVSGNSLKVTGNGEIYSATSDVFYVTEGGSLNIENGTHTSHANNGAVIFTRGGSVESASKTNIVIGEAATLIANKPLAIGNNSGGAYGLNITINGTLKGITGGDTGYNLGGVAISVNGSIKKPTSNIATITINESAKLIGGDTGTTGDKNQDASPAIYAAGYVKWIINAGEFRGDEALSIKAGEFIINGGKFVAEGEFVDPAINYGNGTEATGAAISITANDGYAKNVVLTIKDGEFTSKNGYALYEGNTAAGKDAVDSISVVGGDFEGKKGSVKSSNEAEFISGGAFSSDIPENYIDKDLEEVIQDGVHYVGIKNKISVEKYGEGVAKVDYDEAVEGQTITITATPAEGYKVKSIEVTTSEATIDVEDNKFTMPNDEVKVKVTFEKEETNKNEIEKDEDTTVNKNEVEKEEDTTVNKNEVEKEEDTTVNKNEIEDNKDAALSGEGEKETNPETNDILGLILVMFGASLIGVISSLYIKKKYN